MLKRGIGLYIETMPDEYKWILQRLLSKRDIGIVISDKTLCMGIDLPVRTCCLMEFNGSNNFTNEDLADRINYRFSSMGIHMCDASIMNDLNILNDLLNKLRLLRTE